MSRSLRSPGWCTRHSLRLRRLPAEGISVEAVDPRMLVPLDVDTIREPVRKTGRPVIADGAGPTADFSAEAVLPSEDAATFARLKAPVKRICALQVPIPYSPVLENHVFPDRNRIMTGIRDVLQAQRAAMAA
jgi:pyruvate/2-oxoglutarate/acetoin dehydrogenase E1 component